jgi:hypothetical protein
MKTVAINFRPNNGAGYYSSQEQGSHDDRIIAFYFDGGEELENPPPFSTWSDWAPICDEYQPDLQ